MQKITKQEFIENYYSTGILVKTSAISYVQTYQKKNLVPSPIYIATKKNNFIFLKRNITL
jgi:hypothetical protein